MLVIQSLSKAYASGKQVFPVLKNVNVSIHEKDFVMIMGESGSGKSTFLNCISTLDRPTSGQVLFKNEDITKATNQRIQRFRNHDVSFVFQENIMIDTLTMIENVMMASLEHSIDVRTRAHELMVSMRVDHVSDKFPTQVSTGERQRCAIARALMNKPAILFADEPTAALNPQFAKEVMDIFTSLNAQGQTIVMVTHSLKIASYGNRFLLLQDGTFSVDECLSGTQKEKQARLLELAKDIL
ncbi:MAG: ABC transporter ATP-binding protein [Erysipelotrichia bacterium]|jgi:ABC-type lipoprotein export system ATPase subunit|nr:ABC transporter ATP-binding protein [Erysipelotrichia bacterium]